MVEVLHLYLDDSGARHPDKDRGREPAHGNDWFGLGGVLIDQYDEEVYRNAHSNFLARWNNPSYLRSADVRASSGDFSFLGKEGVDRDGFFEDLYQLMTVGNVLGHACVIDRPGYKARYDDVYGEKKWLLCKTAFSVVVERAAKVAISQEKKLKVFVEKSDKKTDAFIKTYYKELKNKGMPFDTGNSDKYSPLTAEQFSDTLYDLKFKEKSSPMAQLADLFLWPICIGGYHKENRTYSRLISDNKLIDCVISEEEKPSLGIKYSCWELAKKKKPSKN